MGKLMACSFNGSILDLLGDLLTELPLGLTVLREVGVVASVALDANSPTLLGHSEHESPPILRVQISIR